MVPLSTTSCGAATEIATVLHRTISDCPRYRTKQRRIAEVKTCKTFRGAQRQT